MWPDWSGETAVIVGTGPGAVAQPLEVARRKARFIAIKSSWRLAPWADVLYGLDRGWWIANQGAPQFKGLKVSPSPTVCRIYPGMTEVRLRPRAEILTRVPGEIGCGLRTGGGHSGFQAMNLAVQWGAKRLVLAGFDMTLKNGAHWKGDDRGVVKPDAGRTESWRAALDGCANQFARLGITVLVTGYSALRAYPSVSLEQIFGDSNVFAHAS